MIAVLASAAFEAVPAQALVTFSDDFNMSGLDAAWTWENPGRSSVYAVSGNRFNLVVGANNDQWMNVNAAPRILRPQSAGYWTIETKLAASSGNAATFAGLTVYKDTANWISLGWLQESSLEFSGVINGAFTGPIGVSAWYEYLRVRKAGNRYYADASRDGHNWTNVNVFVDAAGALAGARIGFLGKNWAALGPYSVSIEYFRQHDQDVMPALLDRVRSTRKVAQTTGAASPNRTDRANVCGADYGVMFNWQDRTYLAFGDTRSCRPSEYLMRPNTLAFSFDKQPADGLRIDGWVTDGRGEAKALFSPDAGALTAVPTAGIGLGDRAYLFYMNISSWDGPGAWTCNRSSIAFASASDHGDWIKQSGVASWGRGNFNQVAILQDIEPGSTTLYLFGTPCGRLGSVKLMKVDQDSILDKAAYRYFAGFDADGALVWSDKESSSVTVAGGPAGEISAAFNAYLGRYVMTYLDQAKGAIVMREAPAPWGPWSPPVVLARGADYPQLYGAFMKPGFDRDNGRTFYFTMSQFGPYNTFWMETTLP